ncbi:MAG: ATP-binding protein [Opitutaceae bacterium]
MNPNDNPFSPGAGAQPPALAGRADLLEQSAIALARLKAGRHDRSLMIVGLRGVGKTVLLNRVLSQAEDLGYKSVMVEVHERKPLAVALVPELRRLYLEMNRVAAAGAALKKFGGVLRSFLNGVKLKYKEVEFAMEGDAANGAADSGDLESDLPQVVIALGRAAAEHGTAIVIMIDELQYLGEKDLSALLASVHKVSQLGLPLNVVGAGLPQLVGNAGQAKSYAERLFLFPELGPLAAPDAKRALQDPMHAQKVEFTEAALDEIVRVTHGFAYFIQEWGFMAWNRAAGSPIDVDVISNMHAAAVEHLDRNFFRVRFDRLTPAEEGYLRALAELGPQPQRSGAIAALLGRESWEVGTLREQLIVQGMIYSPAHGFTAFTVPLFDEYMKRRMPLPPPKARRKSR